METFAAAVTPLALDDDLRCVVLTGAGDRAFVSGADIDELALMATPGEARTFIGKVHACCAALRDLPVPVIARINGAALGAGLELAVSCDLRVAARGAIFGMPEIKLGVPSVVEAALLPGLVGWGAAREMMLLGETFDAAAALRMGLVDAVVAAKDLDTAVNKRIGSPAGRRAQRRAATEGADAALAEPADEGGDCRRRRSVRPRLPHRRAGPASMRRLAQGGRGGGQGVSRS